MHEDALNVRAAGRVAQLVHGLELADARGRVPGCHCPTMGVPWPADQQVSMWVWLRSDAFKDRLPLQLEVGGGM